MKFSAVENLSPEEINEKYNELITNDIIEISATYWYVSCDNGKSGYFYEPAWYSAPGYYNFSCEGVHVCDGQCCSPTAGSRCNVCGPNRCGYSYAN